MNYTVRQALQSDISFYSNELKKFSKFYSTEKVCLMSDDEEYVISTLSNFVSDQCCFTCLADDEPCGFIIGVHLKHPFNPKLNILAEQFWWVKEEYRNSRAGKMLLEAFVAAGKATADLITFSLLPQSQVKDEALTKYGFKHTEKAFMLEV